MGGCWELKQRQEVMIRKPLDLSQAIRDFSDRIDLYSRFQMEYEQVQSNVKILAKAEQAINICKAHACLRFLFISLRAYAPWCLLLSLHMEASPKDHSQSIPQKRILFQSSVVTGNGVIFLFCLLSFAASISASLKIARGLFCCCLLLEARNSCAESYRWKHLKLLSPVSLN